MNFYFFPKNFEKFFSKNSLEFNSESLYWTERAGPNICWIECNQKVSKNKVANGTNNQELGVVSNKLLQF